MVNVLGKTEEQSQKKALEVLGSLGMHGLAHHRPLNLSGGQQQRAALARALCLEPQVLLFDEPTSSLDPESSRVVHTIMQDLIRRGYTVVVSSHDMIFLKKIFDQIYFLKDGNIVESFDSKVDTLNSAGPIAQFLHGE
jgi:ABC-type polar amino acid transport system ATPase subunit